MTRMVEENSFVFAVEPTTIDEKRPCAFCNSKGALQTRKATVAQNSSLDFEDVPDERVTVYADYLLPFGPTDGTGVEIPICDSCLIDVPVEYDDQTIFSELDYRYYGDGEIRERVVDWKTVRYNTV